MTDRRSILTMFPAAAAFAAFRHDARAQGTSRAPRLKITAVKAVRLRGINSRFVRVHTDQGLTGTGETLDHDVPTAIDPPMMGP